MNIKKTIKAQNELDDSLKDLKKEEVLQVVSMTGDAPVVGLLITQEHYMELVAAQNSPANVLNKEVQGKLKEASDLFNKAQKVVAAILTEDKKS